MRWRIALRWRVALAGLPAVLSATSAAGQLPVYNVPDDPAFAFLGASPKNVANPGTIPKLGIAFANGINGNGQVHSGLAISFLPSTVLGLSPTSDTYRQGRPSFWGYNTQVSVATLRTSGDTASTDLALGVRTIFFGPEPFADPTFQNSIAAVEDRCLAAGKGVDSVTNVVQSRAGVRPFQTRDPQNPARMLKPDPGTPIAQDTVEITYLDARNAVTRTERAVVRTIRNGQRVTQDTVRMWPVHANTIDKALALGCASRGRADVLEPWMEQHWNDAVLALAGAGGTRFLESSYRSRKLLGYAASVVGALPIRWTAGARHVNFGQVAAQVRYEHTSALTSTDTSRNDLSAGVRAMGGRARYNVFVEWNRIVHSDAENDVPDRKTAWSAGAEYMAASNLWLSAGVGDRFSEAARKNKSVLFLNLKWATSREPELGH